MPTGSSNGAKSSRAARSQAVTSAAPQSAHMGSSLPEEAPTNRRAMWGTISPTKPSTPAKLTVAPGQQCGEGQQQRAERPHPHAQTAGGILPQGEDITLR